MLFIATAVYFLGNLTLLLYVQSAAAFRPLFWRPRLQLAPESTSGALFVDGISLLQMPLLEEMRECDGRNPMPEKIQLVAMLVSCSFGHLAP